MRTPMLDSLRLSIFITAKASLAKKAVFRLELAQLVLRQNTTFFAQTICASLQNREAQ